MRGTRRSAWRPDIQYVRDGRFGRGAYRSDFNDFAPRLGIAWTRHAEDRPSHRRRHLLRARHRQRRLRHRAQRAVHDPPRRAGRELPAESELRAAVRAHRRADVHPGEPVRRAVVATSPSGRSACSASCPASMSGEATYFGSAGVHLRRLMSYNNPEPSQLPNTQPARVRSRSSAASR